METIDRLTTYSLLIYLNEQAVNVKFSKINKTDREIDPVDTGRKLNVHKTFRRRPGRLLNVLCTFNLRPVSTGELKLEKMFVAMPAAQQR